MHHPKALGCIVPVTSGGGLLPGDGAKRLLASCSVADDRIVLYDVVQLIRLERPPKGSISRLRVPGCLLLVAGSRVVWDCRISVAYLACPASRAYEKKSGYKIEEAATNICLDEA